MWKNVVKPDTPQITIWRMRIACWMPKATDTHSEYWMLIAYPLQQWLQSRSSMSRCSYVHKILSICFLQLCATRWRTSKALNMEACCNIVTSIKLREFVGTICNSWVVMHRKNNTKIAITSLKQPWSIGLQSGEFCSVRYELTFYSQYRRT